MKSKALSSPSADRLPSPASWLLAGIRQTWARRLTAGIEILNVLARSLLGLGTNEHRASAKLRTLGRREATQSKIMREENRLTGDDEAKICTKWNPKWVEPGEMSTAA